MSPAQGTSAFWQTIHQISLSLVDQIDYPSLRTQLIAQILLQQKQKNCYRTLIYDIVPFLVELFPHDRRFVQVT